MLWFKPKSPKWGREFSQLVEFPDSLNCYFSPDHSFICDSGSLDDTIKVSVQNVHLNQWTHVAIGGNAKSITSFVQISQSLAGTIDLKSGSYLELMQKASNWKVCIGGCQGKYNFIGGIRDFSFYTR